MIREETAIRLHTTERTILKMTCERSVLNTSWEELPEKWREKFRGNADQILSIKGIRLEADNRVLPELSHFNFANEDAAAKDYTKAMLTPKDGDVWVKCKVKEE